MDREPKPVPREAILFDIEYALGRNRRLWPRKRAPGDFGAHRSIAEAVLSHLELCGILFFRRPPKPAHSTGRFIAPPAPSDGQEGEAARSNARSAGASPASSSLGAVKDTSR